MRGRASDGSASAMGRTFIRWKEIIARSPLYVPRTEPIEVTANHPTIAPRTSRTWRSVAALILREMATTYGRSPGGYLWAVVEPLAVIALLSFAFSLVFQAPSLGASFPLFYATGYLPYMLFHDVASKTALAIRFSRPLLNFSAVNWFDVLIARFLLNFFTHLAIGALVLSSMIIWVGTAAPNIPGVLSAVLMAGLLALAVGLLNAFLFLAFPAWERIWHILTRPLFIVSGVFFLFEDVPNDLHDMLWFNPLFHITSAMRGAFYATYDASYVSQTFGFGLALGLLTIGLLLLSRHADGMLHK